MRRSQNSRMSWLETIGNQKKILKALNQVSLRRANSQCPKHRKKSQLTNRKRFRRQWNGSECQIFGGDRRDNTCQKRREIWKKATNLNETSFLKSSAPFPPKPRLKSRVHRQGPCAAWKRPSEHTVRLANLRKNPTCRDRRFALRRRGGEGSEIAASSLFPCKLRTWLLTIARQCPR